MMIALFGFLFAMWILILIGGGIIVSILGPFSLIDSSLPWFLSSGIKAAFSICLVIVWIFILLKVKNWIFKKELTF